MANNNSPVTVDTRDEDPADDTPWYTAQHPVNAQGAYGGYDPIGD